MSLTSSQARIQYTLTGAGQTLTVPFKFIAAGDLAVVKTVLGLDSLLTRGSDYTVTGGGGVPATGAVIMIAGTAGDTITIYRAADLTQPSVYASNDAFPAKTTETAFDRIAMQVQQIGLKLARALRIPITNADTQTGELILTQRAGKLVAFDGSGNVNLDIARDDVNRIIVANPVNSLTRVVDYGSIGDPVSAIVDYGSIV